MSMQAIIKDREEGTATSFSSTQKAKGSSSYAVFGMTDQLDALLQLGEMTRYSDSFLEDPENENEEIVPTKSTATESDASEKSSESSEPVKFTEKAIFEAAGEMSRMEKDTNESLEDELENQIAIMQAQVEAMQSAADWWATFGPAWENYQDLLADPNSSNEDLYEAFNEVIDSLEIEYADDPDTEAQLEQIQSQGTHEYNKEESWEDNGGWDHFWGGHLGDPDYFRKYCESVNPTLEALAEGAVGSPVMFQEALANGQEAFEAQIEQMLLCIQILMDIVNILQGSSANAQTAMFDMEALMMDLEQLQINTNTQQSMQQQEISQNVADDLENNLEQIQESLKNSEHQSGGLFHWTKDFFTSVGKLFEDIGETTYWAVTGDESKAKNGFEELTKGYQMVGVAFKDLFTGDIKQGFEVLFAAALLTMLMGPEGIALLGTEFGQDMIELSTLAIDLEQAYYELIGAGVLAAVGDESGAKKVMESEKKLGLEILANPALETVTQVAMLAIIVAMAATGNELVAGIMLALFIASTTGWMQEGTDKLADATGSQILADVIVIAAVTLLTAGAGAAEATFSTVAETTAAAGEEAAEAAFSTVAETTAAAGEESAAELANLAAEETEEITTQTSEEATKKTSSRGARIAKRSAAVGAFGFGSTLGSSSLALDILEATNKKNSKALAIILELTQVIIAAVTASIGGFTVMTESVGNTARSAEESAAQLTQFASRVTAGATAVGAVSSAAQGGETIIMGKNAMKLSKYRANVSLDEATQTNVDAMIKQTSEELKMIIKAYEEIVATAFQTPAEIADAELKALIQG
ncbi:MAG: hypothetical protein KFB93_04535 [Simkaniaceae bacterium]|nr:MAG: hypothetical protein KFB93_04535 [Simkaniaceae bacterium]